MDSNGSYRREGNHFNYYSSVHVVRHQRMRVRGTQEKSEGLCAGRIVKMFAPHSEQLSWNRKYPTGLGNVLRSRTCVVRIVTVLH